MVAAEVTSWRVARAYQEIRLVTSSATGAGDFSARSHMACTSPQSQNPLCKNPGFSSRHLREWRHDDGSPLARTAVMDLLFDLRCCIGVGFVFHSDFTISGSDNFHARVMASKAAVFGRDLRAIRRGNAIRRCLPRL